MKKLILSSLLFAISTLGSFAQDKGKIFPLMLYHNTDSTYELLMVTVVGSNETGRSEVCIGKEEHNKAFKEAILSSFCKSCIQYGCTKILTVDKKACKIVNKNNIEVLVTFEGEKELILTRKQAFDMFNANKN